MGEVESGQLPSPRQFLQATSVDNILFITGGEECVDGACNDVTSILSWDSVAETWQGAGNLSVPRHSHAAVAVPSSIIVCSGCSAMLFVCYRDLLLIAVSFVVCQQYLQIVRIE